MTCGIYFYFGGHSSGIQRILQAQYSGDYESQKSSSGFLHTESVLCSTQWSMQLYVFIQ